MVILLSSSSQPLGHLTKERSLQNAATELPDKIKRLSAADLILAFRFVSHATDGRLYSPVTVKAPPVLASLTLAELPDLMRRFDGMRAGQWKKGVREFNRKYSKVLQK